MQDSAWTNIAIVGISVRAAGTDNLREFWEKLLAADDDISDASYRFAVDGEAGRGCFAAAMPNTDSFDFDFFGIAKEQAAALCPQQRLLVTASWRALEDAGYAGELPCGTRLGLFSGSVSWDRSILDGAGAVLPATTYGDLRIPVSIPVIDENFPHFVSSSFPAPFEVAESTGAAIYAGCRSLVSRRCDLAVVGASYVCRTPLLHYLADAAGTLAHDGVCRVFGNGAGLVPGEAAVALVLKRCEEAVTDHDYVYGEIRAIDVRTTACRSQFYAPSADIQRELLHSVYGTNHIDPTAVRYLETTGNCCHGAAAAEFDAAHTVFPRPMGDRPYCAVGSVKANFGDSPGVSDFLAVAKAVMVLRHRQIPPMINVREAAVTPGQPGSPFFVNSAIAAIPDSDTRSMIAAVSSLSPTGTLCHTVIGPAPYNPRPTPSDRPHLIVVSAGTREQLKHAAGGLRTFLLESVSPTGDVSPDAMSERSTVRPPATTTGLVQHIADVNPCVDDIAYTLQVGRRHHTHRLAFVAASRDALIAKLCLFVNGQAYPDELFTGDIAGCRPSVILDDADGYAMIERLAARGEFDKLAKLWVRGVRIVWEMVHDDVPYRHPVPGYPLLPMPCNDADVSCLRFGPLLDGIDWQETAACGDLTRFKHLDPQHVPVNGYAVSGCPGLPPMACIGVVLSASGNPDRRSESQLANMIWRYPVAVNQGRTIRLLCERTEVGTTVRIVSGDTDERMVHFTATVSAISTEDPETTRPLSIHDVLARCDGEVDRDAIYRQFAANGVCYGEAFRVLERLTFNDHESLGRYAAAGHYADDVLLLTAILEAAIQGAAVLDAALDPVPGTIRSPCFLSSIRIMEMPPENGYIYIQRQGDGRFDIAILDDSETQCVLLRDLELRRVAETPLTWADLPLAQSPGADGAAASWYVIPFGATASDHLREQVGRVADFLRSSAEIEIEDSRHQLLQYLANQLSQVMLIESEHLRFDDTYEDIGCDAGYLAAFADNLAAELDIVIDSSSFFQLSDLLETADYLQATHSGSLVATFGVVHEAGPATSADIRDVAFTLQAAAGVGAVRIAIVAGNTDGLIKSLHVVLADDDVAGIYCPDGRLTPSRRRNPVSRMSPQRTLDDALSVAADWVAGAHVDWESTNGDEQPVLLTIPWS